MEHYLIFLKCLILSLIFSAPFWKAKEHVYERVKKGEIIVSAKLSKKDEQKYLKLISAGHIEAPLDYTWQQILKFEDYHKMSSHFQNIQHDKANKDLYLEMGAMGYYAKLWIAYELKKSPEKNTLAWQVVRGGFKGLSGELHLEAYDRKTSEISIHGDMHAKVIPIPTALIKLGLEFVGKLMAKNMRKYIENSYQTADIY